MNYVVLLIILTFPVAVLFACLMFKDWEDFLQALKHIVQPDIISAFLGEWDEDMWNSLKILIIMVLWAVVALSVHVKWSSVVQGIGAALSSWSF